MIGSFFISQSGSDEFSTGSAGTGFAFSATKTEAGGIVISVKYGIELDYLHLRVPLNVSDLNHDLGWVPATNKTIGNTFPSSPAVGDFHLTGNAPPSGYHPNTVYRYEDPTGGWEILGTTGTYIDSNGVYTGEIVAQQVTSGTFIGLTFETAATGRRVAINATSNTIDFYDESNIHSKIWGYNGGLDISSDGTIGISAVGSGHDVNIYGEHDITLTADGSIYINADNIYLPGIDVIAGKGWVFRQGFLTSFSETDPVFIASAAHGISSGDISNWNAKLSSFTETDPIFVASPAHGITSGNITGWTYAASLLDEAFWTTLYYKDHSGANASISIITVP